MADEAKPYVKSGISALGSKQKHIWYQIYKNSSNFKPNEESFECTKAFNTFEQSRIKGINDFGDNVKIGGESLSKQLNAAAPTDPGGLAKAKIAEILNPPELTAAKDTFNAEINALNKLLRSEKPEFLPGELGSYLIKMKSDAKETIDSQHKKTSEKLNALFEKDDPEAVDFRNQLKTALNCTDNELVAIQDQMQAALNKTNKEAFEKLEKAISTDATNLFNASKLQFERLAFLADRYHRSKKMHDDIQKQMRDDDSTAASIDFNFDSGDATFRNVDIGKLSVFHTINGRELKKNADGSFSIQLNRFFRTDEGVREDVASLVQALKAQGKEKITLTISNKDPKKAERDARLAFEGAIAAGVEPKNIVIKVGDDIKFQYNDKGVLEKNDLFKEHPSRLSFAMQKAEKIATKTEERIKGTEDSTRKIKDRLEAIKNAPSTPAPRAAAAGPRI